MPYSILYLYICVYFTDLELTLKALEAARHEDERKVASLQAKLTQARNALEALKIESNKL